MLELQAEITAEVEAENNRIARLPRQRLTRERMASVDNNLSLSYTHTHTHTVSLIICASASLLQ
jgi:hypothetical protein